MTLITDTDTLKTLCNELNEQPFICVDTEFIREKTYWPKLCLVQVSNPEGRPFAIDPLSNNLDLSPLFALMTNQKVMKVLHAAHQDIEIFLHLTGQLPHPIFDTQIAAMVCGFGESASYENLARKIAKARIDKSSRFSNWSNRPLEKRQLEYALSDVLHLPQIYVTLRDRLAEAKRETWIENEMAALGKIEEYIIEPTNAWKKIKTRGASSRTLAILREITAVREEWARLRDMPRQHVIRDQSLLEISSSRPTTLTELGRIRGLQSNVAKSKLGGDLLHAVGQGIALKADKCPQLPKRSENIQVPAATVDLLKVLLQFRSEQHSIAARLVAKNSELVHIAAGIETSPALVGWRREIFGEDALKLLKGQLSLTIKSGQVSITTSHKDQTIEKIPQ
jgi:ribonuclease D